MRVIYKPQGDKSNLPGVLMSRIGRVANLVKASKNNRESLIVFEDSISAWVDNADFVTVPTQDTIAVKDKIEVKEVEVKSEPVKAVAVEIPKVEVKPEPVEVVKVEEVPVPTEEPKVEVVESTEVKEELKAEEVKHTKKGGRPAAKKGKTE